MAKFRRLETREGYENDPQWQKGYVFESSEFNGNGAFGYCYALDESTGNRHSWECLERVDS